MIEGERGKRYSNGINIGKMGENTNESEKERTQMIDGRGKKERRVID
jgi:hypothetical protein